MGEPLTSQLVACLCCQPGSAAPALVPSLSRAHQMYYLFGFILVAFLVLCIVSAEVAILLTYFQLCGEVRMGRNLLLWILP